MEVISRVNTAYTIGLPLSKSLNIKIYIDTHKTHYVHSVLEVVSISSCTMRSISGKKKKKNVRLSEKYITVMYGFNLKQQL